MNNWDFNNCRAFLEHMINERSENQELIKAYIKLIEKKTEFDIAVSSHNSEVQKNWQSTQAEVTKESIKKGILPYGSGAL